MEVIEGAENGGEDGFSIGCLVQKLIVLGVGNKPLLADTWTLSVNLILCTIPCEHLAKNKRNRGRSRGGKFVAKHRVPSLSRNWARVRDPWVSNYFDFVSTVLNCIIFTWARVRVAFVSILIVFCPN